MAISARGAVTDQRSEQYRDAVLDKRVGELDEGLSDRHLSRATSAIRDLGGIVRCRACDDAHQWIQVALPAVREEANVAS